MKLSVKQLRIAMIAANLALALGFALHYAYGMAPEYMPFYSADSEAQITQLENPVDFRFREDQRRKKADPAAEMRVVGVYLQPVKKVVPTTTTTGTETEPEEVVEEPEEGPVEGGPLARDWRYVGGIIHTSNPRLSRIWLEKKPEEPASSSSSKKTTTSRYKSKYQSKYQSSKLRKGKQGERIFISLVDRHIVDSDNELDFFVDHVDQEKLVYWMDENPKKMFQLSYYHDSYYFKKGREDRLIAEEKEEEEGEEEEEEKKHIVLVPKNYEDLRESDYQKLVKGQKAEGHLKAVDLSEKRESKTSSSSRSKYDRGKTSSSSKYDKGSRSSSSSKSSSSKKSEAEQMKDLGKTMNDVLESDKASAKDKKAIRDLQKVIKGDKSKRR